MDTKHGNITYVQLEIYDIIPLGMNVGMYNSSEGFDTTVVKCPHAKVTTSVCKEFIEGVRNTRNIPGAICLAVDNNNLKPSDLSDHDRAEVMVW